MIFSPLSVILNPRTYKEVVGDGGEWMLPPKLFLSFFLEDTTSAPDILSSCLFIPYPHSVTSLVMVSCYGREI